MYWNYKPYFTKENSISQGIQIPGLQEFNNEKKNLLYPLKKTINQLWDSAEIIQPISRSLERNHTRVLHKAWHPITFLGMAVNTAGFEYCSEQDIIFSTMYNYQRLLGYCDLYDKCAIFIFTRFDCEVIKFKYDGFEWRIELWKGQYGIETGAEVGIYRRKDNLPMTALEEKIIKCRLYSCVPDPERMPISFILERKTGNKYEELFKMGPEKHWWVTGFRWGLFTDPKELRMRITIEFKNETMTNSFIGALKELKYKDIKKTACKVSFIFDTPKSDQPDNQRNLGKFVQRINNVQENNYNTIKKELGIKTNDPNEIWYILVAKAKTIINGIKDRKKKRQIRRKIKNLTRFIKVRFNNRLGVK